MYDRKTGSWQAELTDYIRFMAPMDAEQMGISRSTLVKAANPTDEKRTLSIDHIVKLENWRASQGLPQRLFAWIGDNINKTVPTKVTFQGLINHISHAKKEADDVSTEALKLLSDGEASLADLRVMQKEVGEALTQYRDLNGIIEQKIHDILIPTSDLGVAE